MPRHTSFQKPITVVPAFLNELYYVTHMIWVIYNQTYFTLLKIYFSRVTGLKIGSIGILGLWNEVGFENYLMKFNFPRE